ncbi:MAG: bacteriophage holin [Thermodesulfobacteriota bacterium]
MKFNVKAFALTCGIFWGLSIFIITWWLIIFYGASGARTVIGLFYFGYTVSALGSIIGLVWGFVDGLVSGAIFAWLYNLLARS